MLPLWLWFIIAVVAFFLTIRLTLPIRTFFVPKNHTHNDFLDPSQQLLGLIYGVLLAFIVVFSWQSYTTLSDNLEKEAIGLFDLWRDAEVFEPETRKLFREAIVNYLQSIHDKEWPLMAKGEQPSINPTYSQLWHTIEKFEAKTSIQTAFLSNLINELNNVNSCRRQRILAITSSTPTILWTFLIGGCFCIITLTGIYNVKFRLYMLLASLQAITMTFAFYLIANFNHPFEGLLAITDEGYMNVLQTILKLNKLGLN